MNVDYLLVISPSTARKIVYANKIMRLNVDDQLIELAKTNLLTIDKVAESLPDSLAATLDTRVLDVVQYSTDHNNRVVIGAHSFMELAMHSLTVALSAKQKILIISSSRNQTNGDNWRTFLKSHKLQFQHLRTEADQIDLNQNIIMVEQPVVNHAVKNKTRDRIVIHIVDGEFGTQFSIESMFASAMVYCSDVASDIAREYQHCIYGFYVDVIDKKSKRADWWKQLGVLSLISNLHPYIQIDQVLTTQPAEQNKLLNMGFVFSSPSHMARLLGVHTGLLTTRSQPVNAFSL